MPAKWHLKPLNGLSREHECDRQRDHATEKGARIGGIACAAREIPPNNIQLLVTHATLQ